MITSMQESLKYNIKLNKNLIFLNLVATGLSSSKVILIFKNLKIANLLVKHLLSILLYEKKNI